VHECRDTRGLGTSAAALRAIAHTNAAQLGAFRVFATRKLTRLETQVSFGGLQKVSWVVYEKRAGVAPFDLYQKVTSQSMAVAGLLTSPALDFVLEKGKTYAAGVHITGDASFAYQYSSSNTAYVCKAAFLTGAFAIRAGGGPQPTFTSFLTYEKVYLHMTTAVAP
jgi:hypothetical protein